MRILSLLESVGLDLQIQRGEVLDAGLAAKEPRGEIRLTDRDLDELYSVGGSYQVVEVYSNQYYRVEEDVFSRDTVIRWKFVTPVITSVEEVKTWPSPTQPHSQLGQ